MSGNYVDLSDLFVDLSDIMLTCRDYVDLSDNIVVVCMALIGQEHVFKIHFLTNEYVTSQRKDLTSQNNYLTSDGRNMPPYEIF